MFFFQTLLNIKINHQKGHYSDFKGDCSARKQLNLFENYLVQKLIFQTYAQFLSLQLLNYFNDYSSNEIRKTQNEHFSKFDRSVVTYEFKDNFLTFWCLMFIPLGF